MAKQNSTSTLKLADRPTAPLPAAAVSALSRLDLKLADPAIVRAVTVYEIATARYDELVIRPASTLSGAEFHSLTSAQLRLTKAFTTLAEAGRLDLIAPAETAGRYRLASLDCRRAAAQSDFDGCLVAQDEMRMCRCQLESAGRLDLIGVA
ncbi:hypothetical protein OOK29_09645 [Streptomyces phaeochromogenes]|uniref:hypothetical protein n=1 Tax=Streptomyces phaeochromogenes TaxID=1923 RepID=UPI0022596C8C|nr:hypothetical protein [Streptomyces phaeochromogenes]MCX5598400.1 hypothetical protein [Streptomyces phaeochromogenes]